MNRLAVLLLAIACVAVVAIEETDGLEEVHDADTPTRQAQRAMLAEREIATAAHATADEDVLGMRLQAVSDSASASADASADKPQPHARRISGAAKSFSPNDKMCVMCQFLTQRIQQDLALGFGGHPFYAGAGTPPYAMISAVAAPTKAADSFMEVSAVEADESESESESEDQDLVEIDSEDESEIEIDAEDEAEEEELEEIETASANEAEAESEDEALIQIEDETESEDEAEDEDESEDEEEEEEEEESEESEDASFLQVSSDDEGEWATPEYTNSESVPAVSSLLETASEDFQTPAYVDAVYQNNEDESSDEASEAEADAAEEEEAGEHTDSAEPTFFESAAVAAVASDSEWTTPEYIGAAPTEPVAATESVEAELTSFVQLAEEQGWTTPTYSDAVAPSNGAKSYARVIVPAEQETSLIEAAAKQTVESAAVMQSESGMRLFAPRIVRSKRAHSHKSHKLHKSHKPHHKSHKAHGAVKLFHTQKRYRSADASFPRPRWNRLEAHSPRHLRARLLAGMALRNAEHSAYDALEAYCSTRLPESYGKYCRPVLRQFRRITEGLSYGDNVNRVCLAVNLCTPKSYIAHSPHDHLAARN